jgi:Icc-related predicted phosphoesterase
LIRIAAVGDVHMAEDLRGSYRPRLAHLDGRADVLLLAGDLTRHGTLDEARVFAAEFADLGVPVVAVLGNHDYHSGHEREIADLLRDAGIQVIEGEGVTLECGQARLGIAGIKGFGGGFADRCASEFGEPETKAFVRHAREVSTRLGEALSALHADLRIALTHYAPVKDTLAGEPPEIYPFLGSYLMAEAIDRAGADLAVHGHAHHGTEKGTTPGGIPVRNVAQPVLSQAFAVYRLEPRKQHLTTQVASREHPGSAQ